MSQWSYCQQVIAWGQGQRPSSDQRQRLIDWELSDSRRAEIWKISADNAAIAIEDRATLLRSLSTALKESPTRFPLPGDWTDWIVPLWTFWLPLAQWLNQAQKTADAPFIQGILGGQGTGKTTLTRILCLLLQHLGQPTVGLSLDDLYLTYVQRQARQQQDPRLLWRGPPGTHDIELGLRTLSALKSASPGQQIALPQFDKSLHQGQGDRTAPLYLPAPNIVLFEGWFVGTQPLEDAFFKDKRIRLPDPIVTAADRQFARSCNHRLRHYLPLWSFIDRLMVLYPSDYRLSQQWRQQAEHRMKAQGGSGLNDLEIASFVTYFWQALHPELYIEPLTRSSNTSLVINISPDHSPGELYSPSAGHLDII
ncbi:MAG: glycerate kinase [Phormidesmis sp.]